MTSLKVLAPLLSRGLWPCLVAGIWLGHAPVLAQGTVNPASATAAAASSTSAAAAPADAPAGAANATSTPGGDAAPPAPSAPPAAPVQTSKPHVPAHKATPVRDARPAWSELTPPQKEALRPLAEAWPSLSELHKRKWLVLSHNFADFSPQEQHKLQQRMRDWASLTARERAQARLHFAEVQQLPGDERRAKWEAYQALSDEQRRKLADDILLEPPRGAALASRPVAPNKLTQPPAPKPDQVLQPRIDTDQIHPKTLLPHFLQGTSTR